MTLFTNTAETAQANGAAVTTASTSAGTAGTGFTVFKTNTGTFTLDTGVKHRGSSSYKMVCADGDASRGEITTNTTTFAIEPYFYISSYPLAETTISSIRNTGQASFVNINSAGKLRLYDNAGTALALTTGSVPLNAWWRLGHAVGVGTTISNGTLRMAYYSGANLETTTPNEAAFTYAGNANAGTANLTLVRFGKVGSGTALTLNMDDIQWNDAISTLIGPVASGTPPLISYTRQRVTEINASGTSGTGVTQTLTQTSGPPVTISGPDVGSVFRVILPTTLTTAAVLSLTAVDSSGQTGSNSPQTITIQPDGTTTSVIEKDFLVYTGTVWQQLSDRIDNMTDVHLSAYQMGLWYEANDELINYPEPQFGDYDYDYGYADDGWPNPSPCILDHTPLNSCVGDSVTDVTL